MIHLLYLNVLHDAAVSDSVPELYGHGEAQVFRMNKKMAGVGAWLCVGGGGVESKEKERGARILKLRKRTHVIRDMDRAAY
jgi:hypothetical protein